MSGNLIGGLVGAVIGFFMGGPSGAYYGFLAGSIVGGIIDPGSLPDQSGPRLHDLKPQASEYGRAIPIVYGTIGIAGNVIWASDLVEVATTSEQGGKGGGPTQSTTTYSYFANFAVALCEGERSVGRIWAGPAKRLIYDGLNLEGGGSLRIYTGSEDQLPDPLIESYLGVGNVPAYRGTCYIVLENFPVAKDGNMIPFLTVEVGGVASSLLQDRTVTYLGLSAPPSTPADNAIGLVDPTTGLIWSLHPTTLGATVEVMVNSDVTETQVNSFSVPLTNNSMVSLIYVPGAPNQIWAIGNQYLTFQDEFVVFNADNQTYIGTYAGFYHGTGDILSAAYDVLTSKVLVFRYLGGVSVYSPSTYSAPSLSSFNIGDGYGSLGTITVDEVITTPNYFAAFYSGSYDGVILRSLLDYSFYAQFNCFDNINAATVFYDSDRDRIIVSSTSHQISPFRYQIIDVASATMSLHTYAASLNADTIPAPSVNIESAVYYGGKYIFGTNTSGAGTGTTLYIVNPDTLLTENTFTYEAYNASTPYLMTHPLLGPIGDKSYIFSFDATHVKRIPFKASGSVAPTSILLSEVVADLSNRAGLTSDQYNVAALTDLVDGYAIASQSTIRSCIDALRPAYYFDAVESGLLIKYVKRGGAVSAIVPTDDLAAHQNGEDNQDPLLLSRQMEVELPRILNVNYLLAATDYSAATKLSKRLVGSSGQEASLELPLVLTDTKAQEIADVNLFVAWLQRVGVSFRLPRGYAYLEPTDVIQIGSRSILIIKISYTPEGILKIDGLRDDAPIYTPNVVVVETEPTGKIVFVPGITTLELM